MSNQYYTKIYSKRLNRYGTDFRSRIEGQRAKEFEDFLLKSPNRVDFQYDGEKVAGVLEQYKQDYSETQGYLLTKKDIELPSGTIIELTDKNWNTNRWMVWWLEQIKTSGYNRYIILKMNYHLEWYDGIRQGQWGYLSTPGTRAIKDVVIEGSAGMRFLENNNLMMFITPYQKFFERDTYLEVENGDKISAYRVVEFDNQATPGVSYLTVESIPRKDMTPTPVKTVDDEDEDFFWLNGGKQ